MGEDGEKNQKEGKCKTCGMGSTQFYRIAKGEANNNKNTDKNIQSAIFSLLDAQLSA